MKTKRFLVNALTFARVPLIFLWAVLAIAREFGGSTFFAVSALVALVLAGMTDFWDGCLARRWGVVSTLGKMADPLMDKVFYVVAFPTLAWLVLHQGESELHALVMLGFTILYMLRDLWVTFIRSVGTMFGADVAAMWLGKVRTALSFPCAGWVYLYLAFRTEAVEPWGLYSCYLFEAVMIVMTLVSFVTYTRAYLPYLKKALDQK